MKKTKETKETKEKKDQELEARPLRRLVPTGDHCVRVQRVVRHPFVHATGAETRNAENTPTPRVELQGDMRHARRISVPVSSLCSFARELESHGAWLAVNAQGGRHPALFAGSQGWKGC